MKRVFIILPILLSGITLAPQSSELSAEQRFLVKIANVSDWVMEQHLDRGKNMWDERDDSFPGIGMALDNGVTDKSVWWEDKEHIERSSLSEKRVVLLEGRIGELYPTKGEVKVEGCEPPSKENGWNICTFDLEELKDIVNLIFEIGGGYKPYEQQLTYAGIRNPSGEIERISIRKEAMNENRMKVAYVVPQSEFSFYLAKSDARDWLDKKFPLEYGVGLLVIQRDKDYQFDTDKCLLKVHLNRDELEKRGFKTIEVVLGWRDKEIRNFPSHYMLEGRDRGKSDSGFSK
jgi:hypothetical protein